MAVYPLPRPGDGKAAPTMTDTTHGSNRRPAPGGARSAGSSLADLPGGEETVVVALLCDGPVRRRLLDLGLVPGTRVRRGLAASGGDPVAYEVRGSVVALRLSTARQILVGEAPGLPAGRKP